MKILGYGLASFLLTLSAATAVGQTITTGPLDRTIYCADDSITVDYTVTGSFAPGNVFLLQMSDTADDFKERFFNLGTVAATGSGSVRGKLPADTDEWSVSPMRHTRFRFRVVASNPVVLGSDNGTDIELVEPNPVSISNRPLYGAVGNPMEFTAYLNRAAGHAWDFGSDANPRIVNGPGGDDKHTSTTTFDSPGIKSVLVNATSEGGCSNWLERKITIFSPTVVIPASAVIVQGETTITQGVAGQSHYWVCPGGKLTLEHYNVDGGDDTVTVYAEFGATVVRKDHQHSPMTVYARRGSVVAGERSEIESVIMYEEGASVPEEVFQVGGHMKVALLTFDYANVPPGGCPSLAPYTVEIKPNSNGIHTESNENGSDDHYRIYGDGDLTIRGDRNTYYLDEGSALELRGSDSRIYAKNGATVNVVEGSNNRIFYELQANLESSGALPILLPSSGITFVGDISGVDESGSTNSMRVQVVPNPARDDARVVIDAALGRVMTIEVYVLATGERLVRIDDARAETSLDLRGLPSGLYGVRVIAEKGEAVKTLRVEAGE